MLRVGVLLNVSVRSLLRYVFCWFVKGVVRGNKLLYVVFGIVKFFCIVMFSILNNVGFLLEVKVICVLFFVFVVSIISELFCFMLIIFLLLFMIENLFLVILLFFIVVM